MAIYQIRVRGQLDQSRSEWFDGLAITLVENGETILSGTVRDQAALHGLLGKIRDLGLPLRAVSCVDHDSEGAPPTPRTT
jgi:hypothetical protein